MLISNVSIQCYKLPTWDLAIPHKFSYSIFIFIQFYVFLFLYAFYIFFDHYLKVCCLITECLEIFHWSFCYWFPVSLHYILRLYSYNFKPFIFVTVCFITWNVPYLGRCAIRALKIVFSAVDGHSVLYVSVRVYVLTVLFRSSDSWFSV